MIDVREHMGMGFSGRYALNPDRIIGIAIHHSVSGGDFADDVPDSQAAEIAHLKAIDSDHIGRLFGGFGYHLACFTSGRWYYCGGLGGARAHVASRNYELIGIVLIGDFTRQLPPPAQLQAARQAIAFVRDVYPAPSIAGHRVWALASHPPACPGDTWESWVPSLSTPPQQEDSAMVRLYRIPGRPEVYAFDGQLTHIVNPEVFEEAGYRSEDVLEITRDRPMWNLPVTYPGGLPPELR